jgi:hypothetical protein
VKSAVDADVVGGDQRRRQLALLAGELHAERLLGAQAGKRLAPAGAAHTSRRRRAQPRRRPERRMRSCAGAIHRPTVARVRRASAGTSRGERLDELGRARRRIVLARPRRAARAARAQAGSASARSTARRTGPGAHSRAGRARRRRPSRSRAALSFMSPAAGTTTTAQPLASAARERAVAAVADDDVAAGGIVRA